MKFGENAFKSADHSGWFIIWVLRQEAIQSSTLKKPSLLPTLEICLHKACLVSQMISTVYF